MKTNTLSLLFVSLIACFSLSPTAQSASPPPDGCYPAFTTAEGCNALASLGAGQANTGIGWYSLFSVRGGNFNTGVGAGALVLNNADSNTAVGAAALLLNTAGTLNVAVGTDALVNNNTGIENTADGAFALFNNTAGGGNIAIGYQAGYALTGGNNNIDIGNIGVAAESNMIRIGDPAIHAGIFLAGITAMTPAAPNQAVLVDPATGQLGSADISSFGVVSTDPENTAVGDQALVHNAGGLNTATGFRTLFNNTTGQRNTATGAEALEDNTTGEFNDAVGAFALLNNEDGFENNAEGDSALFSNIHGAANTALGDLALENSDNDGAGMANNNVAVGASALNSNVDGSENTAVGTGAGSNVRNGYNNTYIGDFVASTFGDESNTIRIGDISNGNGVGSLDCYIGGIFNNPQPIGGNVVVVTLDLTNDHLGWDALADAMGKKAPVQVPQRGMPMRRGVERPAQPQHQSMLKLQATVAQQQRQIGQQEKQIETLTAQLREQAQIFTAQLKEQSVQIQKVSAQLELNKAAPLTVLNSR